MERSCKHHILDPRLSHQLRTVITGSVGHIESAGWQISFSSKCRNYSIQLCMTNWNRSLLQRAIAGPFLLYLGCSVPQSILSSLKPRPSGIPLYPMATRRCGAGVTRQAPTWIFKQLWHLYLTLHQNKPDTSCLLLGCVIKKPLP